MFIGSSSQSRCDDAVALMKESYPAGQVFGKAVDLKSEPSIKSYFEWVDSTGKKGVDHVVFTAGDALALAPVDENLDVERSKDAFDIRVFGVLRVVKAVKGLFNVGGSLTLTTGTVAYKPPKGWSVASAMGGATEVRPRRFYHSASMRR